MEVFAPKLKVRVETGLCVRRSLFRVNAAALVPKLKVRAETGLHVRRKKAGVPMGA